MPPAIASCHYADYLRHYAIIDDASRWQIIATCSVVDAIASIIERAA